MDKKELKRLYDIEYRKRPEVIEREHRRKTSRQYSDREKILRPLRRSNNHRNVKCNEWRKQGIKWNPDEQDPYQMYLDNTHCSLCGSEYRNNSHKQLDHDHLSGHIRGFVCRGCNSKMFAHDNKRIKLCLEIHRHTLMK